MYKRLLSLLLVVCILVPMISMLPFDVLAAADVNAPVYSTSFPGIGNANLPTLESDGSVAFHGNWSAIQYPKGSYNDPTLGTLMTQSSALIAQSIAKSPVGTEIWANQAHMNLAAFNANYFNTAGQLSVTGTYSGAIRYTAEKTGVASITFDKIGNYAPMSKDASAFRYGIFVNGTMVWPKTDGTALSDTDPIANTTNLLAVTSLNVTVGDYIDFVCEATDTIGAADPWAGAGNVMQPRIDYLPTEEEPIEEETVLYTTSFSDTEHIPTISDGNVTFHGNWSVLSVNGIYGMATPQLMTGTGSHGLFAGEAVKDTVIYAATGGGAPAFSVAFGDWYNGTAPGQMHVPQNAAVVLRYTSEKAGYANICLDKLGNWAGEGSSPVKDHTANRYAVYVNGSMIWPIENGNIQTISALTAAQNEDVSVISHYALREGDTIDFVCQSVESGWYNTANGVGNVMFPTISYTYLFPTTAFGSAQNVPTVSGSEVSYHGGWTPMNYLKGEYLDTSAATPMDSVSPLIAGGNLAIAPTHGANWNNRAHMLLSATNANYFNTVGAIAVTGMYSGGVRYVAEHSGTVDISFDQLGNFAPMSAGVSAFRYGVFLNGRMIWPVAGGTLAETEALASNQTDLLIKTDYQINEGDILDFVCEATDAVGMADPWAGAGNVIFPRIAYTLFTGRIASFPGADKQTLPQIVETINEDGTVTTSVDYKGGWTATAYLRGQYANPTDADIMRVKSALGMPDAIAAKPIGTEAWVNKSHMTLSTMAGNYFKKEGQISVTGMYSGGIRYTAEQTGKVDISFDLLGNWATATVGGQTRSTEHFRYGIFLNGEMVWPVRGGTLAFVPPLSAFTNENVLAVRDLEVSAGDAIDFICEAVGVGDSQPWDGAGNVIYPTVSYTETYDLSVELSVSVTDRFVWGGSFNTNIEDALVAQAGIIFDGVAYAGTRLSDGTYVIDGPAFDPKTAVDEIVIRPYLRHMNGLYIYGEEMETSAAIVLRALVNSSDESNSKEIVLAASMLYYAAQLQEYTNYRTDVLANEGILFTPNLKGNYDIQALHTVIPMSGASVTLESVSLLWNGTPTLGFAFNGASDMNGYALQMADNAGFLNTTVIPLQASEGIFTATLTDLSVEEWNDICYFRVVDTANAQVSDIFTYSISAFYASQSVQDASHGIATAMMALYEAYSAQAGGTTMTATSPAMLPNPQIGTTVPMTAAEIANGLKAGTLVAGNVYTVSDNAAIVLDMTGLSRASGNGAIVVAPLGITITGQSGRLSNLTVVSGATVALRNANGATLDAVEIVSTAQNALVIDGTNTGVTLVDTRVTANAAGATAIENASDTLTLFRCYIQGETNAIRDVSAGNNLYEDCVLWGGTNALLLTASDSSLRYSTVYGDVAFGENCENLLVAMCLFRNADDTIRYTKVHNAVVLGNDITNVSVINSTNIYVVENRISGQLLLDNCRYIVAENNSVVATPIMVSCEKYNGDNITDIHARAAVGVNEELLPHINTDAHINMSRKTSVRTVDGTNVDIASYINRNLESDKALIIAPGAYTSGTKHISIHNIENAQLYAYGVLFERETIYGYSLEIHHSKNVSVYGLTVNMSVQSSGLVIVVEKLGNNQVRVVNGAGTRVAWNNNHTNKHESAYRWDKPYSYADVGSTQSSVTFDDNGFATFTYPQWTYEQIRVGDVITCRLADSLTYLYYNENILFEDVSILGGTVRCFWDDYAEEGTTLNRVVDMPMPSKVIDKETYDRYKGYEATYGIYTGVYIDEFGNYRGTAARTATADFAHSSASRTGFKVSNSIVSGLSDDGTNNQGYKDRVAGYDAATGTLTIRNDNGWGYGLVDENAAGNSPSLLVRGEELLIYTSTGKLIAQTVALSDGIHSADGLSMTLLVPKADIPENAFSDFNLSDGYSGAYKVLIHSLDRMGDEVRFDNVRFENIRSRGNLLKSDDIIIKNCSFYNIGMAAIGMQFEIRFGESGFLHDVIIENNYFENTGYFNNYTYYSPITVDNPAVKGTDEYLISSNITIRGNVIRDRGTSHALFLRGVRDVVVENNDFGSYTKENGTLAADVFALFVKNVNFSGNTYSAAVADAIVCSGYRGIAGADLTLANDRTLSAGASYALEEQRPYLNGSSPAYVGNWSAGYMSATAFNYTQYAYVNAATNTSFWFIQGNSNTDGMDAWYEYGYGGIATVARDYRFLPSNGYHSAFRYTMDRSATVAVSLSTFYPPYADTSQVGGSADGLFAVFVNGNMVWPTNAGSYTSVSSWYPINQETSQAEINRSLASLTLQLSAGDQIYFVGRRANAGERTMFSAVPVVYYL